MSPMRGDALLICLQALEQGIIPPERRAEILALIESFPPGETDPQALVRHGILTQDDVKQLVADADEDETLIEGHRNPKLQVPDPGRLVAAHDHRATASPAHPGYPAVGKPWGKYLIEKRLGSGGQGEVFQAFDQLGPAGHVALKIPRHNIPRDQVQQWVASEIEPLVKLDHPNIVGVVDAGCVAGVPYIATKLAEGLPLDTYVKVNPPGLRRTLDWMIRLASALDHAHRRGVIHRDIKPKNIIISPDGEPVLLDLGLARLLTAYRQDSDPGIGGTVPFMAPEQARGEPDADHRVDVFGLGGVLLFLLEGRGPYGEVSSLKAVQRARVTPARCASGPALRRALCRIANRALASDPGLRFSSAREMHGALSRLRESRSKAERPTIEASLEVHFQRARQVGSYQILTADHVPLLAGDRIQVHAKLTESLFLYLVVVSATGEVRVLYPLRAEGQQTATEIRAPSGPNEWFEIEPPPGTETIVLLGRGHPCPDIEGVVGELLASGGPPALGSAGLLVADDHGPRLIPRHVQRPLAAKTVEAEKGFLAALAELVPKEWAIVRVVAFPHCAPPAGR